MPRKKKQIEQQMPEGIWISNDGRYHWDLKRRLKDGRTWRRSSDHSTAEQAVASRKEALKDYDRILNGLEPIYGDNTSVGEWCSHCLDTIMPTIGSRRGQPYKPTTLRGYRQLANCYILPLLADIRLRHINVTHLDMFMAKLPTENLKIATKNFLSRVFSLAEDRQKMATGANPCRKLTLKSPKNKRTKNLVVRHYEKDPNHAQRLDIVKTRIPDGKLIVRKRILSFEEEESLLQFVTAHSEYRIYLTPILLGLKAGLRVSEAIGLEWSEIDLEQREINIIQQANYVAGKGIIVSDPKSEAGFRTIPLCNSLYEHLCQLHETSAGGHVCRSSEGFRLEQARYSDKLRRIMYEAGLGHRVEGSRFLRQPTHHDLRRTCLSRLANGIPAKDSRTHPAPIHILAMFAGHADPKTLLDFYVAKDKKLLRQLVAEMP